MIGRGFHSQCWRIAASWLLLTSSSCSHPRQLDFYGSVPDFTLISQTGQPIQLKNLEGKVWVADFVYTNCTGPCPRMSSEMHQVQEAVRNLKDVNLVSFTVDPARDTPQVLAAYAKHFQAEPSRWLFLTGEPAVLLKLARDGFHLAVSADALSHSTHFALVDRHARVRQYYGAFEPESVLRLIDDIRLLVQEGP